MADTGFSASAGIAGGTSPPLQCFAAKLATGVPLTVAVFGSSITSGHVHKKAESYPSQFARRLRQQFPNVTVAVYGYPGASASFMRACHASMLPVDADLYIVELTDNFMSAKWAAYREAGQAIEQLLFALRRRRRPTDVPLQAASVGDTPMILVAPFPQSCSKRLVVSTASTLNSTIGRKCLGNMTLPAVLEAIGAAHRIPVASARLALSSMIRKAPIDGSKMLPLLLRFLNDDLVHTNRLGSWMLAQILLRTLASQTPSNTACAVPAASVTPSFPLDSAEETQGSAVCAMGDKMREHILTQVDGFPNHGWNYTVDISAQGQPKPGYVAVAPGASLHVCYRGEYKGTKSLDRPLRPVFTGGWWQFGYLRSWRSMGRVRGECVAGCSCPPRSWDAHQTKRVAQTAVSKLLVSRQKLATSRRARAAILSAPSPSRCPCVIRLTTLNTTSSGGYRFKLTALFGGVGRMYNPNFALCPREGRDWNTGGCQSEVR